MSTSVYILSMCLCFILGSIGTYIGNSLFQKKRMSEQNQQIDNAILEVQFRRGIEEGEKKSKEKFTLAYEPFVDITDTFLKRTAEAGYTMQIIYEGIPLGDPMKKITTREEKFKEENLNHLVENTTLLLNNVLSTMKGLPVRTNQLRILRSKKTSG